MDDVTARQVPPMRAGDSDRAATVHRLQDAVARGLLTPDEGSERMAAAFAAVHLRDLPPLTADLPPAPEHVTAYATAPGWRPLGLMAWEQVRATVAGARGGGPAGVRLALTAVAALLVLVLLGSLVLDGLFDGGPGGFDRGWGDGRGPR
ncbi:hypothetical protein JOD57_000939 [Geodermatophilus bullaregiensis]|uniref:DUF1707 SHOCT-like domain-containing protein n=1 Tax=Geodermatophilus bullaregiensis TaxID=1564160 RepID=UPI00195AA86A|nr:DUF1707 domain-containing protein [Geodermatophilus bullaregiensis]MBM7805102.1 hypothetical protein [Geodermatophilus bullaregiensis]